jgi:hypothetical protein
MARTCRFLATHAEVALLKRLTIGWISRGSRGVDDWCRNALSERCRVKDMRHVEILEDIAENSTNEGYRLTAIRDLRHTYIDITWLSAAMHFRPRD